MKANFFSAEILTLKISTFETAKTKHRGSNPGSPNGLRNGALDA